MRNFLFGFLFATIAVPLGDNLVAFMQQITKHICTAIAAKTYKISKELEEDEEPVHHAIGFRISDSEDEYDDDEGDD